MAIVSTLLDCSVVLVDFSDRVGMNPKFKIRITEKERIVVSRMTKFELEAMHTGSLLARLQQLRECEESYDWTDHLPSEIELLKSDGRIHVKDSDIWVEAYRDLKAILDTREHFASKAERKRQRLEKIKTGR